METELNGYQMEFNGEVLERGFWLYVWEITEGATKHLYIGRTGDSSSPHASSAFNRIGQHLDFRPTAKGNSLAKRLKEAGLNPKKRKFRMLALGPFFPEQGTFEAHKPYRDQMATYEYELARHLQKNGFSVLGVHHRGSNVDSGHLASAKDRAMEFLGHASS
jgi:hypothetical protein